MEEMANTPAESDLECICGRFMHQSAAITVVIKVLLMHTHILHAWEALGTKPR
jgi:hypothetical protein